MPKNRGIRNRNFLMNDKQLLDFFNIHKDGQIEIKHSWNEKLYNTSISLKDLLRLVKLFEEEKNDRILQ